jgi:membrane protease YdiL (CAAX protease family)
VAVIGITVVLACATAGPVFNGLLSMGRTWTALEWLRDLTFEEVLSRLALIYLLVMAYPALRWAGVKDLKVVGFDAEQPWLRMLFRGWLLGVFSVVLVYILAMALGAYVWNPDSLGKLAGRLAAYFLGGLIIGFVEELFFRGALFGMLSRLVAWWPAALVVSFFFALMHFIRPQSIEGVVHGSWTSGFELLPNIIYRTSDLNHYVPFALTLFLLSLYLCALYRRQGHVHMAIGLHAGWVLALQMGKFLFDRDLEHWPVFGISDNLSRSWAATLLMMVFLLCLPRKSGHAMG